MRTQFFSMFAVAVLMSAPVFADEPIELSAQQMDQITAGSLQLNNGTDGKIIFGGFDNPAPNEPGYLGALLDVCDGTGPFCHPALNRRSDAAFASSNAPSVTTLGNDGPWTATVVSPKISCPDCP